MVINRMFKKALTSILIISLCILSISCGRQESSYDKEKINIKFDNEEVEILVENVLNKPKEDFDPQEFQHDFNLRLSSFMIGNKLAKGDDDVYKMRFGEGLNKDEGMLNLFLMIYRDKENKSLQKTDIEECLNNGNKDKEAEIADYVMWYSNKSEYVRQIMYTYNDSKRYSENGQSLITIHGEREITKLSEEEQQSVYEKLKDIPEY